LFDDIFHDAEGSFGDGPPLTTVDLPESHGQAGLKSTGLDCDSDIKLDIPMVIEVNRDPVPNDGVDPFIVPEIDKDTIESPAVEAGLVCPEETKAPIFNNVDKHEKVPPEPPPTAHRMSFNTRQLPIATPGVDPINIDQLLEKLSFQQLTRQEEFYPEFHGYPSLDLDDHERSVLFHPDHHRVVCLQIKPWQRVHHPKADPQTLRKFLAWRPLDIVIKTLEHTTQLAKHVVRHPMRKHFKSLHWFSKFSD